MVVMLVYGKQDHKKVYAVTRTVVGTDSSQRVYWGCDCAGGVLGVRCHHMRGLWSYLKNESDLPEGGIVPDGAAAEYVEASRSGKLRRPRGARVSISRRVA
jgi:hypothetical protein